MELRSWRRCASSSTEPGSHRRLAACSREGRTIPFSQPGSNTRVLLARSGKGGVGKSSVSTNRLAVALAARGKRRWPIVGADVWGFSIPRMLGIGHQPQVIDSMLVPPEAHGVRCISMGFFAEEDQAVIWRGPMLHRPSSNSSPACSGTTLTTC
ncbi:MAG: P-loop NTPase [Acidimicrobiales bacterium]